MPLLSSSRSSKERTSKRSSPRVARNCPPSQLAVLSLLPEELEELLLPEVQLPSQSQRRRKRTKTWDSPSSTKLLRRLAFLECQYISIYVCIACNITYPLTSFLHRQNIHEDRKRSASACTKVFLVKDHWSRCLQAECTCPARSIIFLSKIVISQKLIDIIIDLCPRRNVAFMLPESHATWRWQHSICTALC